MQTRDRAEAGRNRIRAERKDGHPTATARRGFSSMAIRSDRQRKGAHAYEPQEANEATPQDEKAVGEGAARQGRAGDYVEQPRIISRQCKSWKHVADASEDGTILLSPCSGKGKR